MDVQSVPRYLALDPGETTGWALFSETGELIKFGQYRQAEQTQWLTEYLTSDLWGAIVEDYRNYTGQKRWSRNTTSKNIGSIELLCEMRGVPCILQPANIKKIGYKWAGLGEAPTNHAISHQYDAIAHGTYWLRMNNILKPSIPGGT